MKTWEATKASRKSLARGFPRKHREAHSQTFSSSVGHNSPDKAGGKHNIPDPTPSGHNADLSVPYESNFSSTSIEKSSSRSLSSQSSYHPSVSQSVGSHLEGSDIIIPDSQPLPGSSSYVPTASTKSNTQSETVSYSPFIPGALATDISPSFESLVPEIQISRRSFRRSGSAPKSSIADSASISGPSITPPSLFSSVSDPRQASQLSEDSGEVSCLEVPDSAEKPSENTEHTNGSSQLDGIDRLLTGVSGKERFPPQSRTQFISDPLASTIVGTIPQDRLSKAANIADITLNERGFNSQPRMTHSASFPENQQPSNQSFSSVGNDQTPSKVVERINFNSLPQSLKHPADMADIPMASREQFEESSSTSASLTSSAREKLKRQKDQAAARADQNRAERQRLAMAKQNSQSSPRSPSNRITRAKTPPTARSPYLANRPMQNMSRASPNQSQFPPMSLNTTLSPPKKPSVPSPGPSSPLARQHTLARDDSPATSFARASQSPSVIPDRPPYQIEEEPSRLEAQPLEIDTVQPRIALVRNVQPSPHTPITPSKLQFHREVSLSPIQNLLEVCNLGKREYAIHLSMPGRIQDHYCATIRYHARAIKTFLESNHCKRKTVEQINTLLDEVSKVTTHIDLQGSGPSSQESIDPKCEADYAESCSEKFTFLGHLIEQLRNDELRICIIANPGLMVNILETYLAAKEVEYMLWHGTPEIKTNAVRGKLKVLVVPSDARSEENDLPWADLLIAFDETFNRERTKVLDRKHVPAPTLRPVVYASLEHIDLCVPRTLNPIERLRKLVLSVLQTQKRVGAFESGDPELIHCTQIIAGFVNRSIITNSERPWPLPAIRPIEGIRYMDTDSSLSDALSDISDDYKPEQPLRYWPNPIPPKMASEREHRAKRPLVSSIDCSLEDLKLILSQ